MSEKIKTGIAVFLIIIILPYIITYALQGRQLFDITATEKPDETDQSAQTQEPTEVLTGILAGQIRMDLPEDAADAIRQANSRSRAARSTSSRRSGAAGM